MLGSLLSNIHHVTNIGQFEQNTVQHCICCVPFSQPELIRPSRGITIINVERTRYDFLNIAESSEQSNGNGVILKTNVKLFTLSKLKSMQFQILI